jgi:UDP-N-acetylglucosamine 3-dehydrogenase
VDYIDQEVKVFPLNSGPAEVKTLKIQKEEPLKKELQNFLLCQQENRPGKVTGEEGLQALRLAYAVLKEAET